MSEAQPSDGNDTKCSDEPVHHGDEKSSDDSFYYVKESTSVCESKREVIINIIALLFLRCIKEAQKFYLASNVNGAEIFSDIFLKCVYDEKNTKSWLLHVNCQESPSLDIKLVAPTIQSSLIGLCNIINKIKDSTSSFNENLRNLDQSNEFEFVFYTTAVIQESDFFKYAETCQKLHLLLNSGDDNNNVLSFLDQSFEDVRRALQDLEAYKTFLSELKNVEDSDEIAHNVTVFRNSQKVENNEVIAKLQLLEENPHEDTVKAVFEEVDQFNTVPYIKLLPYLKLFSKQANKESLILLIKTELQGLGDLCSFGIQLLYMFLIQSLQTWWDSENYYLTKDCDIWARFKNKLHSLSNISKPHLYSVLDPEVRFFAYPTRDMKNEILQNRVLNVVASSSEMSLSCLKVFQVVDNLFPEKYIWITFDTLIKEWNELMQVWPRDNISALVVEYKTDCTDCDTVSAELCQLLISCRQTKLIVISKENNKFVSCLKSGIRKGYNELRDTFKFIDLEDQSQIHILSKEVLFQGHIISLGSLIGTYQQLRECLDASIVSQLLEKDLLVIGSKLHPSINDFIPRTLELLIDIDISILTSRVLTEIFAVSNVSPSELKQIFQLDSVELISVDTSTVNTDCGVFCLASADSCNFFLMLCDHFPLKNLHHFSFRDGTLQWKESKGEIKYLKDFICTEKMSKKASHVLEVIESKRVSKHIPESLLNTVENPSVVVGDSGVGKSTLLNELIAQTKAKDPMNWLLYLNCNEHIKFFAETKKEDYCCEVVLNMMCSLLGQNERVVNLLEKEVLRHSLVSRGNVIVVCDGLDEVRSDVVDKILHFVQVLKSMAIRKLWIASSWYMKSTLQRSFGVVAYELLAFESENQKSLFLSNLKYAQNQNNCERIENFIDALQKVCKPARTEKKSPLTIPLICVIASEVFKGELHEYLSSGSVQWPEFIDVAQMYEKYINIKRECCQKTSESLDWPNDNDDLGEVFMNRHMICALLALYDVQELAELNLQDIPENISKVIHHVEKFGIVQGVVKGKPVFLHKSFAEYFAAMWFSRNIEKSREFLRYRMFSSNFVAIMKFFDYFLIRSYELHAAVLNGDTEIVENLLAYGVDINATDKAGRTALHLAIIHSKLIPLVPSSPDSECDTHSPIVKLLINNSANTKMIDNVFLWRPIQYAIELWKWDAMDLLLKEQVDFNDLDCLKEKICDRQFVQEGLRVASERGYFHLIECFSSCGINISDNFIEWQDGLYNPLHIASRYGRLKLVRYLLSKKIKISIKSTRGISPLHFAASEGMAHVVTYLLQRGSDLLSIDKEGNMPLNYAIFRGNIQMVILLVEQYGCNISIQNRYGDMPLHHAVRVGHLTMVEYFLMKGAQINSCNKEGNTPLHVAVWMGALPVLKVLLEYGADVNVRNKYGETPLSQSAGGGNLEVVEMLVEHGAEVNVRDDVGNTALHWAARQDNVYILGYLISKGADLNAQNKYGNSPLHRAIEHGSVNASKCLICAGCNTDLQNKAGYSARNIKSRSKEAADLFDP